MARNEEKAMSMLNRWWTQKRELHKKKVERPKGIMHISKITALSECEKWRNSILKEINKKVTVIQNAGLGEQRIRELNDEINQLLKEKNHWEHRILELGGPNYRQLAKKQDELDCQELPGFGGYKYFGAAKDLPGVRELFQKDIPAPPKQDLVLVYKNLDMEEYLGKKVKNLEEIEKEEREIEDDLRVEKIEKWVNEHKQYVISQINTLDYDSIAQILQIIDKYESTEEEQTEPATQNDAESKKIVEEPEIQSELERRKQELIKLFVEKQSNQNESIGSEMKSQNKQQANNNSSQQHLNEDTEGKQQNKDPVADASHQQDSHLQIGDSVHTNLNNSDADQTQKRDDDDDDANNFVLMNQ